jgi:TldD protein
VSFETPVSFQCDRAEWTERLRRASSVARGQPLIYDSSVSLQASAENRCIVTSDGTKLLDTNRLFTVAVSASTKAEDGMELSQYQTFNCASPEKLPTEDEIRAGLQACIDRVLALRQAPLVEPYTGPAILLNRAAGVFFHEIFGHRIEGHRQKDVQEGQTFTKKIGEPVLPTFLTVHDDPTRAIFGTTDLRGHYLHDDEGVAAQDAVLVKDGVLQTFLLSRTPVQTFVHSNGHGRRNPGNEVVARQGNLLVESTNVVPFAKLREMLKDECRKQGKPYGLLFDDISGGFTNTDRGNPQAFKVLPVVVFRVYGDGRPDELVRGVDIVGTPLTCFSRIVATGDDPDVFNGTCGAESGWVPVSATAPSILVSEIEVEKRQREQDRPPILPAPDVGAGAGEKTP